MIIKKCKNFNLYSYLLSILQSILLKIINIVESIHIVDKNTILTIAEPI